MSEADRQELAAWSRSRTRPARQVSRAKILLRAAAGGQDVRRAAQLGGPRQRCARVRRRYLAARLAGAGARTPRGPAGRPAQRDAQHIAALTTGGPPPNATGWSRTPMAKAAGVSPSTVGRVGRAHGLKPHRVGTFKVSRDPRFAEKLAAIVGLCLAPPERALVLCGDEQSQASGAGPHAARPAAAAKPPAHADPRPQTPRPHHAVRRVAHARWPGHRRLPVPAWP